jgi:hypothetical protein
MKRILIFSLVLVLVGLTASGALAQEETELLPCPDGEVNGAIVAYDEETGLVTLDVEGELCTVDLSSEYDHPIINLLGEYFGDFDFEDVAEALDALQVCVISDGESYTVSEPAEDGTCTEGELVTVTGEGEEGGFAAQNEAGDTINFELEDEEAAGALSEALGSLQVDWEVEDGSVGSVGDDIGEYHEDGIGFGVLVKVYAIYDEAQAACEETGVEEEIPAEGEETEVDTEEEEVDPCDVTVDLLLEELESMGLGQLFAVYGKPAIMGVGHVRNIGEGDGTTGGDSGDGSSGICNARSHGGNANATGQGEIDCGDVGTDGGGDTVDPEVTEDDE